MLYEDFKIDTEGALRIARKLDEYENIKIALASGWWNGWFSVDSIWPDEFWINKKEAKRLEECLENLINDPYGSKVFYIDEQKILKLNYVKPWISIKMNIHPRDKKSGGSTAYITFKEAKKFIEYIERLI